jgi:hypothetical protein
MHMRDITHHVSLHRERLFSTTSRLSLLSINLVRRIPNHKMGLSLFSALCYLAVGGTALPQLAPRDDIAPKRQEQKTDHPIPGVKRVKIRSGPYRVPNMMTPSFPTGVHGMVWNRPDVNIDKPCDGYCTILRQWAGLEYPNGTNANVDTGMW